MNVRKNSGKVEEFTFQKVAWSIVKAGGTVELAEEVAKRVWEFFAGKREDKEIETKHIKEKVREELKKKNSRIEESYSSHSKN